jgi:hypothetical protein
METLIIVLAVAIGIYFLSGGGIGSDSSGGTDTGSGSSTTVSLSSILAAIARQENVNPSHNNPGAICGSYNSAGQCLGPATFATLEEGVDKAEALIEKILSQNPGISVQDFVTYWTQGPGAIGNTPSAAITNYTNGVASDLGLDPSDPINLGNDSGSSMLSDEGTSGVTGSWWSMKDWQWFLIVAIGLVIVYEISTGSSLASAGIQALQDAGSQAGTVLGGVASAVGAGTGGNPILSDPASLDANALGTAAIDDTTYSPGVSGDW